MIGPNTGFRWRALAFACFVAGAGAVFLVLFNVAGGVELGKRYRLTTVVPTAVALSDNADVKLAGVNIGKVERISNRGATAVLRLAIDPDRAPVHRDARVQVRAKTLVGENYVDLDPGSAASPAIPDGGELPIARAKVSTQLDDVLHTFSARRRARLRRLLEGIGQGTGDARSVGRGVSGISGLLSGGKDIFIPLEAERESLRRLVPDLATVFNAVGERRAMIERLVRSARSAATTVATEDSALRAGLRELPAALERIQHTTGHLAAVGGRADPVLADLTTSLRLLSPVARELPAAAGSTLAALRRLESASPATRRALRSLRALGAPGAALIPSLDEVLRELRPAVSYLAPYRTDIGSFFAGTGQAVTARDAVGNVARIQPVLSAAAMPLVGEPERAAVDKLLGMGIGKLLSLRGHNLLPKPDTLAHPAPASGGYPRVQRDGGR